MAGNIMSCFLWTCKEKRVRPPRGIAMRCVINTCALKRSSVVFSIDHFQKIATKWRFPQYEWSSSTPCSPIGNLVPYTTVIATVFASTTMFVPSAGIQENSSQFDVGIWKVAALHSVSDRQFPWQYKIFDTVFVENDGQVVLIQENRLLRCLIILTDRMSCAIDLITSTNSSRRAVVLQGMLNTNCSWIQQMKTEMKWSK